MYKVLAATPGVTVKTGTTDSTGRAGHRDQPDTRASPARNPHFRKPGHRRRARAGLQRSCRLRRVRGGHRLRHPPGQPVQRQRSSPLTAWRPPAAAAASWNAAHLGPWLLPVRPRHRGDPVGTLGRPVHRGSGLWRATPGYRASVSGMQLVRGQRSPRTWLAVLHHLAGLVIGAVSFPLVLAGVTVGAVLAPIGGSGLPILGLTLRYTDGLAAIERSRFAGLAGAAGPGVAGRLPPPVPLAGDPGPGRLHRPRHLGQDLLPAAGAARQRAPVSRASSRSGPLALARS